MVGQKKELTGANQSCASVQTESTMAETGIQRQAVKPTRNIKPTSKVRAGQHYSYVVLAVRMQQKAITRCALWARNCETAQQPPMRWLSHGRIEFQQPGCLTLLARNIQGLVDDNYLGWLTTTMLAG